MTSNNELHQTTYLKVQVSTTNVAFTESAALALVHRYEEFSVAMYSTFYGDFVVSCIYWTPLSTFCV